MDFPDRVSTRAWQNHWKRDFFFFLNTDVVIIPVTWTLQLQVLHVMESKELCPEVGVNKRLPERTSKQAFPAFRSLRSPWFLFTSAFVTSKQPYTVCKQVGVARLQ